MLLPHKRQRAKENCFLGHLIIICMYKLKYITRKSTMSYLPLNFWTLRNWSCRRRPCRPRRSWRSARPPSEAPRGCSSLVWKILHGNVHHLIFLSSPMLTLHHRNIVKYSILKIQTNSPVKRHAFLDCVNFESTKSRNHCHFRRETHYGSCLDEIVIRGGYIPFGLQKHSESALIATSFQML